LLLLNKYDFFASVMLFSGMLTILRRPITFQLSQFKLESNTTHQNC
jgi:hypothetical protein